jgi:hypothetical protein
MHFGSSVRRNSLGGLSADHFKERVPSDLQGEEGASGRRAKPGGARFARVIATPYLRTVSRARQGSQPRRLP